VSSKRNFITLTSNQNVDIHISYPHLYGIKVGKSVDFVDNL